MTACTTSYKQRPDKTAALKGKMILLPAGRRNGYYVPTKGLMEQDLMDKMLAYLTRQQQQQQSVDQGAAPSGSSNVTNNEASPTSDQQPFFLYYAPNAIHQ